MRTNIILPDASPLFSFVALGAGGLDLILAAGLPVILTDYIEWEATRSGSQTSKEIGDWIAANPTMISIVETDLGQERIVKEKANAPTKRQRKNIGEATIFEAVSEGYVEPSPYLFIFEEDRFVEPSFFGKYPVHSVTTFGFLVGLERSGIIRSADEALGKMRANGREGVKALLVDRPYQEKRAGL